MSQKAKASGYGIRRLIREGALTCWARLHRRRTHAPPPPPDTGTAAPVVPRAAGGTSLWRMRTTVREEPGTLAALCTVLARERIDVVSLETHPLGLRPGETPSLGLRPGETPSLGLRPGETPSMGLRDGEASVEETVDEFLLRAPVALDSAELVRLVTGAGGSRIWIERADPHELTDGPTRMLRLATRTALDTAELPVALRQLLGRCTIRTAPAVSQSGHRPADPVPTDGVLEETVMRLPDPAGGVLIVERPHLPFTPVEFARADALVELDTRLGTGSRVPRSRDAMRLPEGQPVTVRRAGSQDAEAAGRLHERCSERTLSQRYHGPVADADRYLAHLLSPRHGRTLAVETASGKLVALGHLLWDGDETEVALLVEDAWQHRGIGGELLRRLVALALEAGSRSVYAVTRSSNTAMVAAMRGLGLPLSYQVEEGTLVITGELAGAAAPPSHVVCAPTDPN
ncbi:MAG: GNAT family N-acetyltransferase [Streptomyces sp.]